MKNQDLSAHALDALVMIPPLSPSDTNPPLGPYLLKTCFERAGLALQVCDVSIAFLREFGSSSYSRSTPTLGDQDKDRELIRRAKRHFRDSVPLVKAPPHALPDCCDPIAGMHFTFDAIERAVEHASEPGHYWNTFLDRTVFHCNRAPRVLGLSIMGPPQLFVALTVARMAKHRWPSTLIVAGGSHITLLAGEIAGDARYGSDIDAFMPGHCENEFVSLCRRVRAGTEWRGSPGVIVPGRAVVPAASCVTSPEPVPLTINAAPSRVGRASEPFELVPTFDAEDLELYDPARVTIPMQLSRGCLYGRCTMCTYPATEPGFSGYPSWPAVGDAIELLIARHGVRRFSFKDSFMVPKVLRDLADLLGDRRLGIEWSATTMLNERLTPHLLKQLAGSGCRTLEFGLETIWPAGQALLDKVQPLPIVEQLIADTTSTGIVANINLIYGLPGETEAQAEAQLAWFFDQQRRSPGLVTGSHNMLEVNRSSPMAATPERYGISLAGVGPWAFSFAWNAPGWRSAFRARLHAAVDPAPSRDVIVTSLAFSHA